ncbi:MAG: hypothetical protein OEM46_07750 [Ignavibacteria bacterium]|nr:hypothetical protein [Ignavibacteria bacterium]
MDLKIIEIVVTTILAYLTGVIQKLAKKFGVPGIADELIMFVNFAVTLAVAHFIWGKVPEETTALAASGSTIATGLHQGQKQIRELIKIKRKERQKKRTYNPREKKK